jgi:hypothetical protein
MDTQQLAEYMQNDEYISKMFGSVLARDQLPLDIENKKLLYIVNLDPISKPGTHWIAIFMNGNKSEYFDSLGNTPHDDFVKFMLTKSNSFNFNRIAVQDSYSSYCGLYCLFYCYFKSRGYSFKQILDMFTSNTFVNNVLVDYYNYTCK